LKKSKVNDVELPQIPLPTIEAPTIPIDNLKGEPETSHKNSNRRDASPLEKSPRTLTKPGNPTEKKEKRKSLTRKTGLELKDFMNLSRSGSLGDNELLVTRSKSNSLPTVAAIAKSHHHHHHHGNKKQSPLVAIKSEEPSTLIKAQLSDSSENVSALMAGKERPHKFELITLQYENQTKVLVIDAVKSLSTFLPVVCRKFGLTPLPPLEALFLVYINTPDDPLSLDKTWVNIRTAMILADMPKDTVTKSVEEIREAKKTIS